MAASVSTSIEPIPARCSEGFAPQLDWILANLETPHTVATLAKQASMSSRTFARRFVEETGTTPMQWVTDQRVLYARRMLEETDLDVDRVAERVGFGNATLLRHHSPDRRCHAVGLPPPLRPRVLVAAPTRERARTARRGGVLKYRHARSRVLSAFAFTFTGQREPAVAGLLHQPVHQQRVQRPVALGGIAQPDHVQRGPATGVGLARRTAISRPRT